MCGNLLACEREEEEEKKAERELHERTVERDVVRISRFVVQGENGSS